MGILSEESIFVPRRLEDRSLDDLSKDLFRKLLRNPESIDRYENSLNHIDISLVGILIVNHPKLFYYFDHRTDEFTPSQVHHILSEVPDLAERFANPDEGSNRLDDLSKEQVSDLIKIQPQLYNYFEGKDNFDSALDPHNLTNDEIREILVRNSSLIPQIIDKINLDVLSDETIVWILQDHPQLVDHFDHIDFKTLTRSHTLRLLISVPKLYNRVNLNALSDADIDMIKASHPEYSDVLSEGTIFVPRKLEDRSPTTRYVYNILITNPELVEQYEHQLGELESYELILLLQLHPQLMFYLDDKVDNLIDDFEPNEIYALLKDQPQFIDHFKDVLDKLTINHILVIISLHHDLVSYFKDKIDDMSPDQLKTAIMHDQKLIEPLKSWLGILNDDQVVEILKLFPKLSKYFDPNVLPRWFKDQNF